jgi:hypothetical protein
MGSIGRFSGGLRASRTDRAFRRLIGGSPRDTDGPNARAAPHAVFVRSGPLSPGQCGRPLGLRRPTGDTPRLRRGLRAKSGAAGVNGPRSIAGRVTRGSDGGASAGQIFSPRLRPAGHFIPSARRRRTHLRRPSTIAATTRALPSATSAPSKPRRARGSGRSASPMPCKRDCGEWRGRGHGP